MLCCVGLVGGMAVGQSLGGPWTFIAPAAGFGIGLIGDMKLMKGLHRKGVQQDIGARTKTDPDPVRAIEVDESKLRHEIPQMGKS